MKNNYLKRFTFGTLIKYLIFTLCSFLINFSIKNSAPLSFCLYASSLLNGFNFIPCAFLYVLSCIYPFKTTYFLSCIVAIIPFTLFYLLLKRKNIKLFFGYTAIILLSLVPYIFFNNEKLSSIIYSLITTVCFIPFYFSLKLLTVKKLNAKPLDVDLISLAFCYVVISLGVVRLIGETYYSAISLFTLLIASGIFKRQSVGIISLVISLPSAINSTSLYPVAIFSFYALALFFTAERLKFLNAFILFAVDFTVRFFFLQNTALEPLRLIIASIGIILYLLIPYKITENIKRKFYSFEERKLVKQTINSERIHLADKLYEISSLFQQISTVATNCNKNGKKSSENLGEILKEQTCKLPNGEKCFNCSAETKIFDELMNIAINRGRVNVIDIPESLVNSCKNIQALIYNANKLVDTYRENLNEEMGKSVAGKLIADQSQAVAELLKSLAINTGKTSPIRCDIEKQLGKSLCEHGAIPDELLVFGDNNNINIHVLGKFVEKKKQDKITHVINTVLNKKFILSETSLINDSTVCLSFIPAPKFCASYSHKSCKKNTSDISGDTYSVTDIGYGKTLVAISDGMGSGKSAEEISSDACALTECFFRAGLSPEEVASSVNKILSVTSKDTFTAIDIAEIDLNVGEISVMKYGATYSLILTDKGVKIIESGNIPLGILGEITPTVAKTTVDDGDMIIMFSDGISDNFDGTANMIDFLTKNYTADTNRLADAILKQALKVDKNSPHDDMSVICLKIKRNPT